MGVTQGMQAYSPAANSGDSARPFAAKRIRHKRLIAPRREHKVIWRASTQAKREALLILHPPMCSQFADD